MTNGMLPLRRFTSDRMSTGIIGIFFQLAGVIGAIRLAKPESWWARRRYRPGSKKALKSAHRFDADYQRRWNRLRDLVAGAPDPVPAENIDAIPLSVEPLGAEPPSPDRLSVRPPSVGP